ncbi:ATP-binding protein [Streptomyces sp. CRN 30]|uniref:ATP-binding protein n=1 Tax=Streptomyces sp. CRN 30 TaxID=3075613 RepID=UPI002A809323|nr:ATP-binding protein [Streptomyces sp. CRN 30]
MDTTDASATPDTGASAPPRAEAPASPDRQEAAAAPARPVSRRIAAAAREEAEAVVRGAWGDGERRPREEDVIDLLLVVSELVGNAVRHGGGLAAFEARAVDGGVRLDVSDHSPVVPAAASGRVPFPARDQGSGYGWPLIARLARDVTVRRRPGRGKTISVLVPVRAADPR